MSWSAQWFNGRDSGAQAVVVDLVGNGLQIRSVDPASAEPVPQAIPLATLLVSERFAGVARRVQLPDGSVLAVDDDPEAGFDFALRQNGHQRGFAASLMQSWPRVVACLVVLFVFLAWMDRQGAGMLASLVVPLVPASVDERLGATTLTLLEDRWMGPSQVSARRQQRLFSRVKPMIESQHPDQGWRLAFRNMRNSDDAFNALTLPGGTIVLLDGLTGSLTDEQVIAVIGHEFGHVVHRHTMKRILRQLGLLAVAGVLLGDVSGLATVTTAGYQDLHYSRDAEREADAFAIEFLRRGNLPVRHMAEAFEEMRVQESSGNFPGFLSSHPPTEERLRLAREAAAQ